MDFLNKMERKLGRFAIEGLMKYLIAGYVIGYIIEYFFSGLLSYISLEPYMILHYGQVWRLVSWILIPPTTSRSYFIFAIIMIIFYYQLGTVLERAWGAFRFNVYVFGGMIFTVLGAFFMYFIMGTPVSVGGLFNTYYINLSIFLAFALSFPDNQVMLYFLIPIKMKWLAIVYAVLALVGAFSAGWVGRVAIFASLLNFIIFFLATRNYKRISPGEIKRKTTYRKQVQQPKGQITKHKCAVCGRTELDDPSLEFRFCSKCDGNYEYCQDHLFTHKHVKR